MRSTIDYELVRAELNKGNPVPLIGALETDICPHIWEKNRDLLERFDKSVEFDDFFQNCCETVFSQSFLSYLITADSIRNYLLSSLTRQILTEISDYDPRRYYYKILEKFLLSHSSDYVKVKNQVFALPKYQTEPFFGEGPDTLYPYFDSRLVLPYEIKTEEIKKFIDDLLEITKAPVAFTIIWDVFKHRFGVKPLDISSIDLLIDNISIDRERDVDVLLVVSGEEGFEDTEVFKVAEMYFEQLDKEQKNKLRCFAEEFLRVTNSETDQRESVDWERIKSCMKVSSHQKARNQIYYGEDSLLKRYSLFLSSKGYSEADFTFAVQILVYICQHSEL